MSYLDDLSEKDILKSILASNRRGEKRSKVQVTMDADDVEAVLASTFLQILRVLETLPFAQIQQALESLHGAIAALPAPVVNMPEFPAFPAPVVYVDPPDLSDIVTAVASLKPGATAEDVASLLAGMLRPDAGSQSADAAEVLTKLADSLEKLDFRLKGIGGQAFGGGSVSLQPGQSVGIANWADMPPVTTSAARPATSVASNVASSATNVTLLASNADRLGATIYNDSTALLLVKYGATASASSFSAVLAALDANGIGGYLEVPYGYTGIVDGLWASANGAARVVEMTA